MANLSERIEPFTPKRIMQEIRELRKRIDEVASSLNTVGNATVMAGKSMVVTGGGGIDVRDGGVITGRYPSGNFASYYGRLQGALGEEFYGTAVVTPENDVILAAWCSDAADDLGNFAVVADAPAIEGHEQVYINSGRTFFQIINDQALLEHDFAAGGAPNYLYVGETGVTLQTAQGPLKFVGIPTTGSGPNLNIDIATGSVRVSVSSRRYKQDIEDTEVDVDAVLALTPRRFRMKADVEELGDDAPWQVGFIAEEAAELGLEQWVTRNSDDGEVEAFDYATYTVALQAAVRSLNAANQSLSERVAALEGNS